jgi:hypothetical protein
LQVPTETNRAAPEQLERITGLRISDVRRHVKHSAIPWLAATLSAPVFEAKFMLPWSFSEEAAAEKYMAQLQHNMWVEKTIPMDPLYLSVLVSAEKKFGAVFNRVNRPT